MAGIVDPFTGTWSFNAKASQLSTPLPRRWVQVIVATREELVVREDIVRLHGPHTESSIWARFDGTDYPVSGLPFADCLAYQRPNSHSISAIGKKDGVITLTETISVTPNGQVLTLIYSIQTGASQAERGVAVFDRQRD